MATIKMDSSGYTVEKVTANRGPTTVTTKIGVWTSISWVNNTVSDKMTFAGSTLLFDGMNRGMVVTEKQASASAGTSIHYIVLRLD